MFLVVYGLWVCYVKTLWLMFWFETYGFVLRLKHLCYFGLLIFKVIFQLGFVSMCFVVFYGLYHTYAAFMFYCLVLLAKCYAFSLSTLLLCPSRILFLGAYTLCIMHWLSVGHASDLH